MTVKRGQDFTDFLFRFVPMVFLIRYLRKVLIKHGCHGLTHLTGEGKSVGKCLVCVLQSPFQLGDITQVEEIADDRALVPLFRASSSEC
jgi:hypothetical protein